MTEVVHMLATAGGGPVECEIALRRALKVCISEAEGRDISVEFDAEESCHGVSHALLTLTGSEVRDFAKSWLGSVLWRCPSPLRPSHKRKNWFVGFFELDAVMTGQNVIPVHEIKFDTFRAGGPGGQHQNTTDSAVRARWQGYAATARSERSQHRNKALAINRLRLMVAQDQASDVSAGHKTQHTLHQQVGRGNPVRTFRGAKFQEG